MQSEMLRRITALLKRIAQAKTYIGRVSKGFDFLGFHCRSTGMAVSEASLSRRDKKIARLYEQGASKERVGAYLRRWLGWAGMLMVAGVIGLTTGCDNANQKLREEAMRLLNEHGTFDDIEQYDSGGIDSREYKDSSKWRGEWIVLKSSRKNKLEEGGRVTKSSSEVCVRELKLDDVTIEAKGPEVIFRCKVGECAKDPEDGHMSSYILWVVESFSGAQEIKVALDRLR